MKRWPFFLRLLSIVSPFLLHGRDARLRRRRLLPSQRVLPGEGRSCDVVVGVVLMKPWADVVFLVVVVREFGDEIVGGA